MGVQGLNVFVTENSLHKDCQFFSDNELIIDGNNLLCGLERNENHTSVSENCSSVCNVIRNFIEKLRSCQVRPIFIFDGGHANEKNTQSGKDKYRHKIICWKQIMVEVLQGLNIPTVWCDYEADSEIAKIANECKCPVLSEDNDFYIMELNYGFINYKYFEWKTANERGIECKIFDREQFCQKTKISKECISLVAAFTGTEKLSMNVKDAICCLEGHNSVDTAIDSALNQVGISNDERAHLKKEIMYTSSLYDLPEESPAFAYHKDKNPEAESDLKSRCCFPSWFIKLYRERGINKYAVDVVLHHQRTLRHSVNEQDVSLSLRRLQYGILVNDGSTIKEYRRTLDSDSLNEVVVQPTAQLPNLVDISNKNENEREKLFFQFLESNKDDYAADQSEFYLPMASLNFLLQKYPVSERQDASASDFYTVISKSQKRKLKKAENQQSKQAVAQWMIVLKHAISLNHLLRSPIPEFDIKIIYSNWQHFSQLLETGVKRTRLDSEVPISGREKTLYDALKEIIEKY
ncbi:protein asteroid homolog 1-like [Anneissia japonica]|uniref:protein asteroid homolog 1-like n=1 Tax=Anneissia japonica TaxID=1529436 RepID=UPI00142579B9|nr:protein asteroid homolog 1-like [Anneissia japonica]XP_033097240.1 protein asteroid homolog 1-like [Anneissia japonica]